MYRIKIIPIGIPPSSFDDLEAKNKAQEIEIDRLMKLLQKQCDEMEVLMNLNKRLEGERNTSRAHADDLMDRFEQFAVQTAIAFKSQSYKMVKLRQLNKSLEGERNLARDQVKRISDRFAYAIRSMMDDACAEVNWIIENVCQQHDNKEK